MGEKNLRLDLVRLVCVFRAKTENRIDRKRVADEPFIEYTLAYPSDVNNRSPQELFSFELIYRGDGEQMGVGFVQIFG